MTQSVSIVVVALGFLLAQNGSGAVLARDGATVRYEEAGEGEAVLLLAGGPGFTPAYLNPVCEHLAASSRCVLLHQRGTGLSTTAGDRPAAITLRTFVEDVEALRQRLSLERVTLVGHSWGGMLAMSYAVAYPDRIVALVLIGSGGPTLDYMRQYNRNIQARITDEDRRNGAYWEAQRKRGADPRRVALGGWKADLPASFHDRSKVHMLADSLADDAFNPQAFQQMMRDLRRIGYDLRPQLRRLRAPVLIVQGRSDPIATAEALSRDISSARLELIDEAGHYPWLEQPAQFFGVVDDFLGRLP